MRWNITIKILAGIYWAILLTLTHIPRLGPLPDIPGKDKTIHFLAYCFGAILLFFALLYKSSERKYLIGFIIALMIVGMLDEWTQPFFNRTCSLGDWIADASGIIIGTLIVIIFARRKRPI